MQFSVDPDELTVLASPWAMTAEVVAALDLATVLAPLVVALPGSTTAAAVPMVGPSWSWGLRSLGGAMSSQSTRLGTAAHRYAGEEAGVRSLFSGAATPAGSQGPRSPGAPSPGGPSQVGGSQVGGSQVGGSQVGGS